MAKVLDASALMAYLEKEEGYEKVKELLIKAAETDKKLLMAAVNFGEVYYAVAREHGLPEAERISNLIQTFPVEFIEVDLVLARQAAILKATHKLPFADCFAAALTRLRKGELVTTDKDFKAVEGEIKIIWV